MARTSITTARYNPFTMEELYSPVLRATEQHLQQQEKYDELANQMNVWKYRLPQDSEARKLYDNYEKMFNAAVDDLNANGINNPSARDNARALIRENPLPALQEAYNRQQKDEQINRGLGPNVRFLKRNTLDDYLKGTEDNTYVNLDDIKKNAATDITNVAKGIVGNPTFKLAKGSGGQFWDVTTTQGITNKMWDLAESRKQNPNWSTGDKDLDLQLDKLNNTVSNVYDSSGYNNFVAAGNESGAADIDSAIKSGLLAGTAVTSHSLQGNKSHETRGERIANDINQLRLDEMNREKGVMDRLAAGQGTDADKWYARTHGIDPETGAKVSSRTSSGVGKTTSRVMSYIPQTISLDAKGHVTGRGDKSINETMSSDKTYHTVPFKELSKGQQTQVLTQMGYTKEEINAMYKETPVQPTGFRNPITTNVTASEFIGNTELDPEVLSSSLTIYVKDNTKKPGKESDAGLIIKPNSYQTSADFTNDFINSNMSMNALQNLWELGETSNPSVENAGYDEDVQSSVDADLQ